MDILFESKVVMSVQFKANTQLKQGNTLRLLSKAEIKENEVMP